MAAPRKEGFLTRPAGEDPVAVPRRFPELMRKALFPRFASPRQRPNPRGDVGRGLRSAPVFRALVVVAALASGVLLGACGAGSQPSATDLTACGTVNNLASGVFVVDPLAEQQALAAQLASQAKAAGNALLITGAAQLQAAATVQSKARVNAALARVEASCTSMGIGPSSGGV
jgi:hypothetical protein